MDDVAHILKDTGAVLEGHFIGTSGKHVSVYINKNKILIHTDITSALCKGIAEGAREWEPDVVAAPATGGIALSQWTAHHLSAFLGHEVLSVYTEEVNGKHSLSKRGFDDVVRGKRVLVVEDIVNTGKSVGEVVEAVKAAGGIPVGTYVLVNRNPSDEMIADLLGVPFRSLHLMPLEAYAEDEVPDWLKKIPINTAVGHGAKYLKEHPQQ
ncbi:MAG: phosphoribosyltransferase [Patescibacteria group bacterium]|nr:phosphoribosyltransferase [Patescibacteria group bacterium]